MSERRSSLAALAALLLAPGCATRPADGAWIELFNGRDLSHWVVKITGHAVTDAGPLAPAAD